MDTNALGYIIRADRANGRAGASHSASNLPRESKLRCQLNPSELDGRPNRCSLKCRPVGCFARRGGPPECRFHALELLPLVVRCGTAARCPGLARKSRC